MQPPPKALQRYFRIYAALFAILLLTVGLAAYSQKNGKSKSYRITNTKKLHQTGPMPFTGEPIPISITPNPDHIPNAGVQYPHAVKVTIYVNQFDANQAFVYVDTDGWSLMANGTPKVLLGIYLSNADGSTWTKIPTPRGVPFKVPINANTGLGQFAVEARSPASAVTVHFSTSGSAHPHPNPVHPDRLHDRACRIFVNP